VVDSLFSKSGFLDDAPLLETVSKFVGANPLKRKLLASAVDVESGHYIAIDFDDLKPEEYASAIVSSASVPFAFPF
jgi:predicted acylesterase/phospholipase RssA